MMRAAVIDTCGKPPAVAERPAPAAGPGEVRVRVTAASITPLDLLCSSGTSYFGEPATPYVPGVQGVGELDDGSPVWFATSAGMRPGDGSMAEFAVATPEDTVPLPDGGDPRLVGAPGRAGGGAGRWRGGRPGGDPVGAAGWCPAGDRGVPVGGGPKPCAARGSGRVRTVDGRGCGDARPGV